MSGAGGAAASDMYNRQLHPDEGIWIKKNASRYAQAQGISLAQAEAELTGQAERQTDSAAAGRYIENQNARAFLSQMTGSQGTGFVYFDGKADGTYDNHVLFAGGLKDSATLAELYDQAWSHYQTNEKDRTNLSGSNQALSDAARDVDNFLNHPLDAAKVVQALRDEVAKAEAAQNHALVRTLESKLAEIQLIENGGYYFPREDFTPAERAAMGALLGSLEGKLSRAQVQKSVARAKIEAVSGVRTSTPRLPDSSETSAPKVIRNAEVLVNGKVALRQNPVTGEYEAPLVPTLPNGAGGTAGVALQVPGQVQSRINLQTGDKKAGWEHVLSRHFDSSINASQFTIGKNELRVLLQSKEVVNAPILRVVQSTQGPRYVREIELHVPIGIDKFSGKNVSVMTVLTDKKGNLVTATPGLIK